MRPTLNWVAVTSATAAVLLVGIVIAKSWSGIDSDISPAGWIRCAANPAGTRGSPVNSPTPVKAGKQGELSIRR